MRMPTRRKMPDAAHIFRPTLLRWVLRTRDYETAMGQFLSRKRQEFIHFCLPVRGIGSHIAQVACIAAEDAAWKVVLRLEGAIERQGAAGVEIALKLR